MVVRHNTWRSHRRDGAGGFLRRARSDRLDAVFLPPFRFSPPRACGGEKIERSCSSVNEPMSSFFGFALPVFPGAEDGVLRRLLALLNAAGRGFFLVSAGQNDTLRCGLGITRPWL